MAPELPDLKVAGPSADACLVIDRSQRIVQWSDSARRLLNITLNAAIGLDCASAVAGRDASGNPVCHKPCAALDAIRDGRPSHANHMLMSCAGESVPVTCNLVPLPRDADKILITLTEQLPNLPEGSSETSGPKRESAQETLTDLAGIGSLAASIGTDSPGAATERTLDWLRQTLDVEAAELFLREPGSDDMLLSYLSSPYSSAFTQINRFRAGEGFPGLVLSREEALLTTNLPADKSYLRTRVKDEGFLSYVCIPLQGSDGIIGTLNIAARRRDLDTERAQRLLEWASVSLTGRLESASFRARLGALPQPSDNESRGAPNQELETLSHHLLQKLMSVGNAIGGELIIHAPDFGGTLHRVAIGGIDEPLCGDVKFADEPGCPALGSGHGIALHGRRLDWQPRCQHMSDQDGVTHCLPLIAAGEPVGLARLRYNGNSPSPPTSHLALLLAIAAQAAPAVKQARDAAQRAKTLAKTPGNTPNGTPENREPLRWGISPQTGEATPKHAGSPFLDIRCFGSFELRKEGRLMPPDAVQRRGAIVLLKMLLISEGRAIPRDMLSEALWPGADPGVTSNRLYVLVHALRRAIEPETQLHRRRWTFICNDGDRYYFNPDAPWRSDIRDFRRAVENGERLERSGDLKAAVDSYSNALDLYTGDLFEDEPYAEWCWAERETLRETALGVATKAASYYALAGVPAQSIVYYQRALRFDPLREQNHRGLIEGLLAAGRRSEALRQYSVCRDLLQRELDIEPMPETERLYLLASKNPS